MSKFKDSGVSVYDRMVWPAGAIEHLLATGERRREVMSYLGEADYLALQPLAAAAAKSTCRPDHCVYLIPGIMGSQLSIKRPDPLPANLLWIDPTDFQLGNLLHLRLPGPAIESCGPVLYSYLPLKLTLEAAGYTVRYFDYDWRLDLAQVGALLAARIHAETCAQVHVIGHSMGGLVARAAMSSPHCARVAQLITLGTPHRGSFAPVQALRGVYPLIRRIAQLDPARSAEFLAQEVFSTFPSLYQMLPETRDHIDLRDIRQWPRVGPSPDVALLASSRAFKPIVPEQLIAIAGYGQPTVVNAEHNNDQFIYQITHDGDGTVPLASAAMEGRDSLYCEVLHGELPRSPLVHESILQLLAGESANTLTRSPPATTSSAAMQSDAGLRTLMLDKINWSQLDLAARRQFLDSLNAPPRSLP